MSGLTVGYLSIDSLILEIKMENGTYSEKEYANKIYKLVRNHHWLLVTLLLCNSFACEAMPIFLAKLVNEMVAVILSVTVLLFVGEIIPQALCTGPNQMKIASILAPFTYFLMIITYPISYPIARFMDYIIGVQGKSRFCKTDLKSLIKIHVEEIVGNLPGNQQGYYTGFFDIMDKEVGELIHPIEKTLKLDYHTKINKITLKRLKNSGYSRIPIYENNPSHLIGILRMKELVGKDVTQNLTLSQMGINLSHPIRAYEDTQFLDLFEMFKEGKSHMAFIHQSEENTNYCKSEMFSISQGDKSYEKDIPTTPIKGIITLEDLIECWLKISILDETDVKNTRKQGIRRQMKIFSSKNFNNLFISSKSPINIREKENNDHSINDNNINNSILINNYQTFNDDETKNLI